MRERVGDPQETVAKTQKSVRKASSPFPRSNVDQKNLMSKPEISGRDMKGHKRK